MPNRKQTLPARSWLTQTRNLVVRCEPIVNLMLSRSSPVHSDPLIDLCRAQMERDDPEALKRVAQAAIARAAAAMLPKKAAEPEPLEPLGLEVPGAVPDRDLDGEGATLSCSVNAAEWMASELVSNVKQAQQSIKSAVH